MIRAFFLAALAVTASASLLPITPSSLFSRQTSPIDPNSFPTQCQSICTAIVETLNSCTSASCLCTSTNGNNLETCMNCLVGVDPTAAEIAQAQTVLNDFDTECVAAGISVLSLTSPASSVATTAASSAIGAPTSSLPVPSFQTTVGGSTPTSITGITFNPSTAGPLPSTTSTADVGSSSSSSGATNPFVKSAAGKVQASRIGWMVLGAGLVGALMV